MVYFMSLYQDADDCEEWERHEALNDDPANVERNKERLFEEPIELKWEKGGSGLVFYTDAQYWKEQEGGRCHATVCVPPCDCTNQLGNLALIVLMDL